LRVLGIDPGIRTTGFGIIDSNINRLSLIASGTISPKVSDNLPLRLNYLFEEVELIINKFSPDIFSIEDMFYSKNVKSSLLLGHARGVSIAAASTNDLLVYEYSARKIKQSLTGNGNAHKDQVRFMVKNMLKLNTVPNSSDASDALAIALCYALQNKLEF